ncbi:MAG: DUF885 family protein [Bacteroidota bacterium]
MKKLYVSFLLGLILMLGCESTPVSISTMSVLDPVYEAFVGDDPEYLYIHRPGFAQNYNRYKGRFTPLAHHDPEAKQARIQSAIDLWKAVDTLGWGTANQLHYQALGHYLQTQSETEVLDRNTFPFNPVDGVHLTLISDLALGFTFGEKKDTEYYSDRLRNFTKQLSLHVAEAKKLAEAGVLPPKYMLEEVRKQVDSISRTPALQHPLLKSIARQLGKADPVDMNEYTAVTIIANTEAIIEGQITGAYQRLLPFIDTWIDQADTTSSPISDPTTYALHLKKHLGYTVKVDTLHNGGMKQFAIQKKRVDLTALPTFRAETEILYDVRKRIFVGDSANAYQRRMQRNARGLFDSIPNSRPEIVEMPDIALDYTPSWGFMPSAMDGSRKSMLLMDRTHPEFASLENDQIFLYTWGIPGVHLYENVHQELLKLGDWPRLIQYHGPQAGWRLLAGELAVQELGLLSANPTQNARYQQHKLVSLAKLIVDTGFHLNNWSRTKGIRFLATETGISPRQAQYIMDRIILYPGEGASEWIAYQAFLQLQRNAKTLKGEDYLLQDFYQLILNFSHFPLENLNNSINELL